MTALLPNKRLKLPARVEYCMTTFSPARRQLKRDPLGGPLESHPTHYRHRSGL